MQVGEFKQYQHSVLMLLCVFSMLPIVIFNPICIVTNFTTSFDCFFSYYVKISSLQFYIYLNSNSFTIQLIITPKCLFKGKNESTMSFGTCDWTSTIFLINVYLVVIYVSKIFLRIYERTRKSQGSYSNFQRGQTTSSLRLHVICEGRVKMCDVIPIFLSVYSLLYFRLGQTQEGIPRGNFTRDLIAIKDIQTKMITITSVLSLVPKSITRSRTGLLHIQTLLR